MDKFERQRREIQIRDEKYCEYLAGLARAGKVVPLTEMIETCVESVVIIQVVPNPSSAMIKKRFV